MRNILVFFYFINFFTVFLFYPKKPVFAQNCQNNDCIFDHAGSSVLNPTSCLENNHLKICFDDIHGGAIQSLYNKQEPEFNFIFPTMGGAFQLDFRSNDPITFCPGKPDSWGQVWNPTQAGCESCYQKDGQWWHSPSLTYNQRTFLNEHYIEFRPRNYFHHNLGDCDYPLPYTTGVKQAEDIYVKQRTQLIQDYLKIEWNIKHEGNHTHATNQSGWYRHELPVIYFGDLHKEDVCFRIAYQDSQGNIRDERLPCKTGALGIKSVKNNWFTIYDPSQQKRKLTFVTQNSLEDNRLGKLTYRNFFASDNGMQLEFSSWTDIEPNQQFTVKTHVFPYRYDETMENGEKVVDFISRLISPNFTIQGYKLDCPAGTKIKLDGSKETTAQPYYLHDVLSGHSHMVSLELPSGSPAYNIFHSFCDCCINHPDNSFIKGSQHDFSKHAVCDGDYNYYDLYWKCTSPYDLNQDGQVDTQDIKILLQNWGISPSISEADLNSDGLVNGIDFGMMVKLI